MNPRRPCWQESLPGESTPGEYPRTIIATRQVPAPQSPAPQSPASQSLASDIPPRHVGGRGEASQEADVGLLDDILNAIQTNGVPNDPRPRPGPVPAPA